MKIGGDPEKGGYVMKHMQQTSTVAASVQNGEESFFISSPNAFYTLDPRIVNDTKETLPVGLFTNFTRCYMPRCQVGIGCYAPRCPNKPSIVLKEITVVFCLSFVRVDKNQDGFVLTLRC